MKSTTNANANTATSSKENKDYLSKIKKETQTTKETKVKNNPIKFSRNKSFFYIYYIFT
jgi:hypothetical protein